ncbi:MAG: tetratricopeptide repeat protein [Thermoplasmata archaeon]
MPGGAVGGEPPGPGEQGAAHVAFQHARSLAERGAFPEAIAEYQEGLRLAPNDRGGLLGIARTFQRAGDPAAGVRVCDSLLAQSPEDVDAWRERAEAYRALRNPQELLYSLTAIARLDPSDRAVQIERSEVLEIAGEIRAAHDALDAVLRIDGPDARDPTLYLRLGDLAARLSMVAEAEAAYGQVVEIDPGRTHDVTLRRVRLLMESGRPDLALERLDAGGAPGTSAGPADDAILLLRAEILSRAERPAEARAIYEEILRKDASSAVAVAGTAHSLMEEGKHSEARDLLRSSLDRIPRDERLVLLLAEAESGLGNRGEAAREVQHGLELLPSSSSLWIRLGELDIAREDWDGAAAAFTHAIGLDPGNASILLRSGFVAERRGRSTEALASYDRAVQIAPHDGNAWTRRGLALLADRQPEPALASFDRALQIDPESDAAKEGKKAAGQKRRELAIDRQGLAALRLEAELRRPVTKNDLFVSLRVPFEMLDPVMAAMGRTPKIDVYRLPTTELAELEAASVRLITSAAGRWPGGIEPGALSLADIAVLSPPESSLDQVQRLFGYLEAVLHLDIRPENLELAPDVEELARQAMSAGGDDRTAFELVRDLRIGIFKARLIQTVERAGGAAHAPLPTLTLGGAASPTAAGFANVPAPVLVAEPHFFPHEETAGLVGGPAVAGGFGTARAGTSAGLTPIARRRGAEPIRCIGCGGIAAITHVCGAPICEHCLGTFRQCPKCRYPVDQSNAPIGGSVPTRAAPAHARPAPPLPAEEPEPVALRAAPPRRERAPPKASRGEPDRDGDEDAAPLRPAREPRAPREAAPPARPVVAPPSIAPAAEAVPAALRPPRRMRTDEEPRL